MLTRTARASDRASLMIVRLSARGLIEATRTDRGPVRLWPGAPPRGVRPPVARFRVARPNHCPVGPPTRAGNVGRRSTSTDGTR
jgi:hypothetical protein